MAFTWFDSKTWHLVEIYFSSEKPVNSNLFKTDALNILTLWHCCNYFGSRVLILYIYKYIKDILIHIASQLLIHEFYKYVYSYLIISLWNMSNFKNIFASYHKVQKLTSSARPPLFFLSLLRTGNRIRDVLGTRIRLLIDDPSLKTAMERQV